MLQTAVVTELCENNRAVVLVNRQSACGENCKVCGMVCTGGERVSVMAKNIANAAKGDRVTVESPSGEVVFTAFLVYIVPLVLFFLFYALGEVFFTGYGALAGIMGFLAGIVGAIIYGRIKKGGISFRITEVLPEENKGS